MQASIYDFQPFVVSGEVEPPANPLVVPQFCLRFNDIDNVGITGAHYTGFVMIGQHAFVQPKEDGAWQPNNHEYGFIPVVPGNVTSLKMLLAMIFLVKLEKHPKMCWLCGSTDIRWDGNQNSWKKCLNCKNDWRETHCGGCGFSPLYRNDKFTFQFRHEHLQESSNCGYSICPRCGMCGKCKMSIDEILGKKRLAKTSSSANQRAS